MKTSSINSLLLKFRSKDTSWGVTRNTVKALAKQLGVSETQVIHMALSKLAMGVLPAYAPDDGPLTTEQVSALRMDASERLPKGRVLASRTLFADR